MAIATSSSPKKKRRFSRPKRTLDPGIVFDYKDAQTLKRFVTEHGKIVPRRISGASAQQQRSLTIAVKRARFCALIPNAGQYIESPRYG